MNNLHSSVKRLLTGILAAAVIATSFPEYAFAASTEPTLASENEEDAIVEEQDAEESIDENAQTPSLSVEDDESEDTEDEGETENGEEVVQGSLNANSENSNSLSGVYTENKEYQNLGVANFNTTFELIVPPAGEGTPLNFSNAIESITFYNDHYNSLGNDNVIQQETITGEQLNSLDEQHGGKYYEHYVANETNVRFKIVLKAGIRLVGVYKENNNSTFYELTPVNDVYSTGQLDFDNIGKIDIVVEPSSLPAYSGYSIEFKDYDEDTSNYTIKPTDTDSNIVEHDGKYWIAQDSKWQYRSYYDSENSASNIKYKNNHVAPIVRLNIEPKQGYHIEQVLWRQKRPEYDEDWGIEQDYNNDYFRYDVFEWGYEGTDEHPTLPIGSNLQVEVKVSPNTSPVNLGKITSGVTAEAREYYEDSEGNWERMDSGMVKVLNPDFNNNYDNPEFLYYVKSGAKEIHVQVDNEQSKNGELKSITATIGGQEASLIVDEDETKTYEDKYVHHYYYCTIKPKDNGEINGPVEISAELNNTRTITFKAEGETNLQPTLCEVKFFNCEGDFKLQRRDSKTIQLSNIRKANGSDITIYFIPYVPYTHRIKVVKNTVDGVTSDVSKVTSGTYKGYYSVKASDNTVTIETEPVTYQVPVTLSGITSASWSDSSNFTNQSTLDSRNKNITIVYDKSIYLKVQRVKGYNTEVSYSYKNGTSTVTNSIVPSDVTGSEGEQIFELYKQGENIDKFEGNHRLATGSSVTVKTVPRAAANVEAKIHEEGGSISTTETITLAGGANIKNQKGTSTCTVTNAAFSAKYNATAGKSIKNTKYWVTDSEGHTVGDVKTVEGNSPVLWSISKDDAINLWDNGYTAHVEVNLETTRLHINTNLPDGVTLYEYFPSTKDSANNVITPGHIGEALTPSKEILYNGTYKFVAKLSEGKYASNCKVTGAKHNNVALKGITDTSYKTGTSGDTETIEYFETNKMTSAATILVTMSAKKPVTAVKLDKAAVTLGTGSTAAFRDDAKLKVTVTPSDASIPDIEFVSSNPSVLTVAKDEFGNGVLTPTGNLPDGAVKATVTVTARATDGSNKSAVCTVTVNQRVETLKIGTYVTDEHGDSQFVDNVTAPMGKNTALTAVFNDGLSYQPADKMLTWTIANPTVATINAAGVVTPKAGGFTTVYATSRDGGLESNRCTIEVTQPVSSITVEKAAFDLGCGSSDQFNDSVKIKVTPMPLTASKRDLEFELPQGVSEDVLAVYDNGDGTFTFKAGGLFPPSSLNLSYIPVKFKATDGSGKVAQVNVTIKQHVESVHISESAEVDVGKTIALTPEFNRELSQTAANKALTWESTNPTVATVSAAGVVTGKAGGTATIIARAKDGGIESNECVVTVKELVSSITLKPTAVTLRTGSASFRETATLEATVLKETATDRSVTYTSGDKKYLTVEENHDGTVTLVPTGSLPTGATKTVVPVTVKANDDSKKFVNCTVTLVQAVESLEIGEKTVDGQWNIIDEFTVPMGTSKALTAVLNRACSNQPNNKAITWSVSDPTVATVNANGVVTPKAGGKTTVIAKAADNGLESNAITINVTQPVASISVEKAAFDLGCGSKDEFNDSVTIKVTALPLTASKRDIVAEFPAKDKADDALTEDDFANCLVVTNNEDGTFTFRAVGEFPPALTTPAYIPVTFRATDGSNKTAQVKVTIKQHVESVHIMDSATIAVGKSITLTADFNKVYEGDENGIPKFSYLPHPAANKNVTWESLDPSVATVNAKGVVTGKAGGKTSIIARSVDGGIVSNECEVEVIQPVASVAFEKAALTSGTGTQSDFNDSILVKAVANPVTASKRTLTYSISKADGLYAKLNTDDGTNINPFEITGVPEGEGITLTPTGFLPANASQVVVKVTAKSEDGTNKSAVCNVTIKQHVETLEIGEKVGTSLVSDLTTPMGKAKALTAVFNDFEINSETHEKAHQPADKTLTWVSSDPTVATVDARGVVTPKAGGKTTIMAVANDGGVESNVVDFTVTQPVSSISLDKSLVLGTGSTDDLCQSATLTATALPLTATDRGITWSISEADKKYVTVDNNADGSITITAKTSDTFPANKAGVSIKVTATATDASKKSAVCTVTINQVPETLKINNELKLAVGKSQAVSATFNKDMPHQPADKGLIYESYDTSVATVSATGVVKAVGHGTTTVVAISKVNGLVSNECTVNVVQPATMVSFNHSTLTMETAHNEKSSSDEILRDVRDLILVATPENADVDSISYVSSNPNFLEVKPDEDDNTLVHLATTGELGNKSSQVVKVTATVTSADNSKKSCVCTVTINERIETIRISDSLSILTNKRYTITPVINEGLTQPVDKTLIWESDKPSVATVSKTGVITAVSAGTAIITAKSKDGIVVSNNCVVNVKNPAQSIVIFDPSNQATLSTLTLGIGQDKDSVESKNIATKVGFTGDPLLTDTRVQLTSSNTNYLTITEQGSNNGNATLIPTGELPAGQSKATVKVTARTMDGTNKTHVIIVNIVKRVDSVTLPGRIILQVGKRQTLQPTFNPGGTQPAIKKIKEWKFDSETNANPTIADVNANGVVTGITPGTTEIWAIAEDGEVPSTKCVVYVVKPASGINLSSTRATIPNDLNGDEGYKLRADLEGNPTISDVDFTSSNTDYLKIVKTDDGTIVKLVPTGDLPPKASRVTVQVTARTTDGSNRRAVCNVTIVRLVETIEIEDVTIGIGKRQVISPKFNSIDGVQPDNKGLNYEIIETRPANSQLPANTELITISSNGIISAKNIPGVATVKATPKDGSGAECEFTVTVVKPVSSIECFSYDSENNEAKIDKTIMLKTGSDPESYPGLKIMAKADDEATINNSSVWASTEKKFTYTSSAPEYLEVVPDATGDGATVKTTGDLPKGRSNTLVKVTAKALDGSNKTAVMTFNVYQITESVELPDLTNNEIIIPVGKRKALYPVYNTNRPDGRQPLNKGIASGGWKYREKGTEDWKIYDPEHPDTTSCAIVMQNGVAVGKKVGETTEIKVVSIDGTESAPYTVRVVQPANGIHFEGLNNETQQANGNTIKTMSVGTTEEGANVAVVFDGDPTFRDVEFVSSNEQYLKVENHHDGSATHAATARFKPTGNLPKGATRVTVQVTAKTLDGSNKRAVCNVTVIQYVNKIEIQDPINIIAGRRMTVVPKFNDGGLQPDNKSLTWKSNVESLVTVTNSGVLTAKPNVSGDATVTVTANDGSKVSKTFAVRVNRPAESISISGATSPVMLSTGSDPSDSNSRSSKKLTATLTGNPTINDVEFVSSAPKYLTVTNNGDRTCTIETTGELPAGQSKYTVRVTAKTMDGSNKSASIPVTIYQKVESIRLPSEIRLNTTNRTRQSVQPIFNEGGRQPANKKITGWSSSNPTVAEVVNGVVVAYKEGVTEIKATNIEGEGAVGEGVCNTCTVRVIKPATGITLDKTNQYFLPDGYTVITATLEGSPNISYVDFTLSDDKYVKLVRVPGSDTSIKVVGQAHLPKNQSRVSVQLYARTTDGSNKTAVCTINLVQAIVRINEIADVTMKVGERLVINPVVNSGWVAPDASFNTLKWESSKTEIATVNRKNNDSGVSAVSVGRTGVIDAKAPGTTVIHVYSQPWNDILQCNGVPAERTFRVKVE